MPRYGSHRPSFKERGKRLLTRALALTLISGVIIGVTGAAGHQDATTPQGALTLQSAAFVAPSSTALPVSLTRVGASTPAEGIARPIVLSHQPVPTVGAQLPQTTRPITIGHGGHSHGVPTGDPAPTPPTGGPTGDPTPTPTPTTGGPTGDPGHNGPTGDPGQNGPTGDPTPTPTPTTGGPTGDPGQNGPTGDPGQNGPTGDPHGDKHHRRDGQGGGNSGQGNPPVANPTPTPPTTTPTPPPTTTHAPHSTPTPTATTPATTPTQTTTPATTPTTTPAGTPKSHGGKGRAKGSGFSISGLTPVSTKPAHVQTGTNPLLSADGSGLGVPLNRVAAALAGIGGAAGLPGGTADSAQAAAQAAVHAAAVKAAAAKAAAERAAARKAAQQAANSHSFGSMISQPVVQFVRFIPDSVWLALAASLGLAAMGGFFAIVAGRRARRQANRMAEVSAVALTDPLTGALNRRGFIAAAERELDRAGRHERPFVLAYIDVRGLKRINDGEGHMAGDQLLRAATAALTETVRAHDVVGRLGGDEFGLLLTEQTAVEAEQVAERIAEQVTSTRAELGFSAHWDLTVGLAAFPQDGASVDELLATADRRLYEQRGIELAAAR